jgi:hypothetical protein
MPQDRSATITVERASGHHFPFGAPWVCIDGRLVGRVRKGRRREFSVTAGQHVVWVYQEYHVTGAISFSLGSGERVDVICKSNQLPLDPWHVLSVWVLSFHVALDQVGSILSPIRVLVREYLIIATLPVMIFGLFRILVYFRRMHRLKNSGPVVWLEVTTAGWSPGIPEE